MTTFPGRPLALAALLVAAFAPLVAADPALAQSARNVLVVVNANHPGSVEVGEYYARVRGVPPEQVLKLNLRFAIPAGPGRPVPGGPSARPGAAAQGPTDAEGTPRVPDEIAGADYDRQIERPIGAWLARHQAHDRILAIVLTKGIPLRIAGTGGRNGTRASVDSTLALLYRKLTGRPVAPGGAVDNPYFLGDRAVTELRPFSHAEQDIYLVTRLDGFTVADAKALVDRAQAPRNEGRIVLDMKAALSDPGNDWLAATADRLGAQGLASRVELERTSEVVSGGGPVLGYFSWGSGDPAVKARVPGLVFAPGAIAASFVSTDARTLAEPPADWTLGSWERRETWFAGSPQSLAGDLVRAGVTGVAGQVSEPFLDRSVRPQVLFPAYLSGRTLAEAFYAAIPVLGWQAVVLGDPLCRVSQGLAPADSDLDPGIDPATELPRHFAARRLETAREEARGAVRRLPPGAPPGEGRGDVSDQALQSALQGQSRLARGDRAGAKQALEAAIAADPRLNGPRLALASIHEEDAEYPLAVAQYRAVLDANPDDIVALNNLAFALAVREGRPADALPLARRAYTLSRGEPTIADTLGWVGYLLGDLELAKRHVGEARRALPGSAEVRFHAAAVAFRLGAVAAARQELEEALRLDHSLESRADVRRLRTELADRP